MLIVQGICTTLGQIIHHRSTIPPLAVDQKSMQIKTHADYTHNADHSDDGYTLKTYVTDVNHRLALYTLMFTNLTSRHIAFGVLPRYNQHIQTKLQPTELQV